MPIVPPAGSCDSPALRATRPQLSENRHVEIVCAAQIRVNVTDLFTNAPTGVSVSARAGIFPVEQRAVAPGKIDRPPLKWSDLRYVFDIKEDCNGKEAIQA